mmetsp:Transcript_32016/g.74461  ORF Transcript_32016/g.74461 Transcript_32016/m.74461 type:complete len:263 (-) Transcript_32016:28-816(-)
MRWRRGRGALLPLKMRWACDSNPPSSSTARSSVASIPAPLPPPLPPDTALLLGASLVLPDDTGAAHPCACRCSCVSSSGGWGALGGSGETAQASQSASSSPPSLFSDEVPQGVVWHDSHASRASSSPPPHDEQGCGTSAGAPTSTPLRGRAARHPARSPARLSSSTVGLLGDRQKDWLGGETAMGDTALRRGGLAEGWAEVGGLVESAPQLPPPPSISIAPPKKESRSSYMPPPAAPGPLESGPEAGGGVPVKSWESHSEDT